MSERKSNSDNTESSRNSAQLRAINNRKRFERIRATASYNRLTVDEARRVYKNCLAVLEAGASTLDQQESALFTALSLITGRKQTYLKSLEARKQSKEPKSAEYWSFEGRLGYLVYSPEISRKNISSELERSYHEALLETVETVPFRLPLPEELVQSMQRFFRRGIVTHSSEQTRGIPQELYVGLNRPVSLSQISSFLSFQLKGTNLPSAAKGFLKGSHPDEEVALYYTQLRSEDILPAYLYILNKLQIDIKGVSINPGELVGSSLKVNESILASQLAAPLSHIEEHFRSNLESCLTFHNEIAYYTLLVVQLLTGHRHAHDAVRSVQYIDLETGHAYVNDKNARLVPLSDVAVEQLKSYESYLKLFYKIATGKDPKLAAQVLGSLNGSKPLLFLLSEAKNRVQFERKYLKRLVPNRWPLPENFPRHFIQSKLVNRLLPEDMSATIGHLMGGQAADDQYSGAAISSLATFSTSAGVVASELGIKPIEFRVIVPEISIEEAKEVSFKETKNTREDKRFWNDARFLGARSILQWDEKFEERLQLAANQPIRAEELRALIMYSAITRGGLYDSKMVEKLNEDLTSNRLNIWALGDTSFVTLKFEINSGPFNLKVRLGDEDFAYRQLHWPIDPLTQLLIHAHIEKHKEGGTSLKEEKVFPLLRQYFQPEKHLCRINSLSGFCRVAPWISSAKLRAEISYALLNAGSFYSNSFCPDKESLVGVFSQPQKIDLEKQRLLGKQKKINRRALGRSNKTYKKVRKVLSGASGQSDAVSKLSAYLEDSLGALPVAAQCLIQWIIYKLDTIKLRSAYNYLGRIGQSWLRHLANEDLSDFEEEDFLRFYTLIIEDFERSGAEISPKIDALRRFHKFGMVRYGWAWNEEIRELLKSDPAKSFVRTYITSHQHVYAALQAFEKLKKTKLEIIQLKLITILAFRGGLRISEILKLRLRDVNPGEDWLLFVKGTRSGANKTRTSLRLSLAISWMNDEERSLFQEYFHHYSIGRENRAHHLFGELGENKMLVSGAVSDLVSQALKQSMQHPEIVFHSLRHTYASAMQCILEKEWDFAETLTGHKRPKLEEIRTSLMGHKAFSRDGYWELAKSTGHATPGQLLLTYAHMSSLLLHQKLSRAIYQCEHYQEFLKKAKNIRRSEIEAASHASMSLRQIKSMRKHYLETYKPDPTKDIKVSFDGGFDPTLAILRNAIRGVEDRKSLASVIDRYPMFKDNLGQIVERADRLMETGTTSTGARFATSFVMSNKDRWRLAPDLPNYPNARLLAAKLSKFFIEKAESKRGRQQTLKWCQTILEASTANLHYLKFTKTEKLANAINAKELLDILSPSKWHVGLNVCVKKNGKSLAREFADIELQWRTALPGDVVLKRLKSKESQKMPANRDGTALVTIDHAEVSSSSLSPHKQGVKVVVWVAYMLFVTIAQTAEIEAFLERSSRRLATRC